MTELTFLGVPIDSVGRAGGTEHGPAKLRALGLADLCEADAGDLDVRIRGEVRDPVTGILGSADVLTTTTAIRQATAAALTSGERPFLVGGCCTVLPGALAAARDVLGRTAVAYLDGHLDLSDGVTSPTGEAADMPLSVALGRGPAAWVDICGGATSRVEDVVPIGFRDPDEVPTLEQIAPELGPAFRPISMTRTAGIFRAASTLPSVDALSTTTIWWARDGGFFFNDSRQCTRSARAL